MYPILFQFGDVEIYTFGVLVSMAFLAAVVWIVLRARQAGENAETFIEIAFWMILSGILGARLFYFIFFPSYFLADPLGALLSKGGLVWYGGMIAVTLTVFLLARIKKLNLWKMADIVTLPAALGLAIGRLGCLMAGCCYGAPCDLPWAIHYPHSHETAGIAVHPAPLYETSLLLLVTGALLWIDRRKSFNGLTAWMFFVLYGMVRFVLEYFRGDRLVWLESFNLSASQLISLGGILLGLLMIFVLNARQQTTPSQSVSTPVA